VYVAEGYAQRGRDVFKAEWVFIELLKINWLLLDPKSTALNCLLTIMEA
jgi:hypothetical protein